MNRHASWNVIARRLALVLFSAAALLCTVAVLGAYFPATVIGTVFTLVGAFFLGWTIRNFREGVFTGGSRSKILFYRRAESPFHFWFTFAFRGLIYALVTVCGLGFICFQPDLRRANRALVPTPASVTPAADAPVAPAGVVAHP
jgi:hypothetical protein